MSDIKPEDQSKAPISKPETPPAAIEAAAAMTMPSRPSATMVRKVIDALAPKPEPEALASDNTPWVLQQFFNGEVDLDVDLAQRF